MEAEGPNPRKDAGRSILSASGEKRTRWQVQGAIDAGIKKARGGLGHAGARDFLFPRERPTSVVRRRGDGIMPMIDMIWDEEIEEALDSGLDACAPWSRILSRLGPTGYSASDGSMGGRRPGFSRSWLT